MRTTALLAWPLMLFTMLAAANGVRSGCHIQISSNSFSTQQIEVDAALFGPHLPLTTTPQLTQSSAVTLVPEGCFRGCTSVGGMQCASLLTSQALVGMWALVERVRDRASYACDEGAMPGTALTPAGIVRECQQLGATHVLLVEARDDERESLAVSTDAQGVTIPAVWALRAPWLNTLALTQAHVTTWRMQASCSATDLPADGTPVDFAASPHRSVYFTYRAAASTQTRESLAFVASPRFGAPRLFISHSIASSTNTVQIPHAGSPSNVAESSAGAIPSVHLPISASGVYLISVSAAHGASNGTMRVFRSFESTSPTHSVFLRDGEPQRVHVPAHGWARVQVSPVLGSVSTQVATAVLAGQGEMYICSNAVTMPTWTSPSDMLTHPIPSSCNHLQAFGANVAHPGVTLADSGYLVAFTISLSHFLYIYSSTGSVVALTPHTAGVMAGLAQGIPQAGSIPSSGSTSFSVWSSDQSGFAISMMPAMSACGEGSQTTTLTLRSVSGGSALQHVTAQGSNSITTLKYTPEAASAAVCVAQGCGYDLIVQTSSPCRFSVVQTANVVTNKTDVVPTFLQAGIPSFGHSTLNGSRTFAISVPNKDFDLILTLTPFSGDSDMYASTKVGRPSLLAHQTASQQPGHLADQLTILSSSVEMIQCFSESKNSSCTWYVAVNATGTGAATYSMLASHRFSSGPARASWLNPVGDHLYSYQTALGQPLPIDSLWTGNLVAQLSIPSALDPCQPITGTFDALVVVLRNSCPIVTQLSHLSEAHAAVIVLVPFNTADISTFRCPAEAEAVPLPRWTVPVLVIPRPTWTALSSHPTGRSLSLSASTVEIPRLSLGLPQAGRAACGEMTPFGIHLLQDTTITVTISIESGDCSLYAGEDGQLPTLSNYSMQAGGTGVLRLHSVHSKDLIVGVYAWTSCAYSIVASSDSDAGQVVYLQDGVPMHGQTTAQRVTYYQFQPQQDRDIQVVLTPIAGGNPDLRIAQGTTLPSMFSALWTSAAAGLEVDHILIDANDPKLIAHEPLTIQVVANASSSYAVAASSAGHGEAFAFTLLRGRPFRAHVESSNFAHFRFTVPATINSSQGVIIRVAPDFGDPDLYVSAGLPASSYGWPDSSSYTWEASDVGADTMRILADDSRACPAVLASCRAEDACTSCTYFISVRAWSETTFTITATLDDMRAVTLQEGVAYRADGALHSFAYYDFELPTLGEPVEVTLTALSGDPDVYGSFVFQHPSDNHYDSAMMSASSDGVDSFTVQPSASTYPASLPAVLHLAIHAYTAATYTIMVRRLSTRSPAVLLVPGTPQTGTLAFGQHGYYEFHANNDSNARYEFQVEPLGTGDPDLFVSTSGPPSDSCDTALDCWRSISSVGDTVVIAPMDPRYCVACTYYVMVRAASARVHFTISASVRGEHSSITSLQEGVPTHDVVPQSEYRFFEYDAGPVVSMLVVTLTTFSGDADIYGSFIQHRPTEQHHNFSSTLSGTSIDTLRISRNDPHACHVGSCRLFFSVFGYLNSSFSIVVTQGSKVHLIDGQPQHGSLEDSQWAYYRFEVNGGVDSFQIDVNAQFGDPDIYVSVGGESVPSQNAFDWSSTDSGSDILLVSSSSQAGSPQQQQAWCSNCTYSIGIFAWTACTYTITISSHTYGQSASVLLQEGVPVRRHVEFSEFRYFRFAVTDPNKGLIITATPQGYGDVDVFVSFTIQQPSQLNSSYAARTAGAEALHIAHTEPNYCPRDPCSAFISVLGQTRFMMQSTRFTIEVHQTDETPVRLTDGQPLRAFASRDSWKYYRFAIAQGALPNASLLQHNSECRSARVYLGVQRNLAACTSACAAAAECDYFIFGKDSNAGECYAQHVSTNACPEGFVAGSFDFYALRPSYLLRHAGAECASADESLGNFADAQQCATAALRHGAKYFIFGEGNRAGRCYAESTPTADCPEGWQPKPYNFYEVARGPLGTTEFTVSVTPSSGDPDIYISNSGALPDSTHYGWHAVAAGEDAVTVDAHDPGWCSGCEYIIGVTAAQQPSNFSIVAATRGAVIILEDGVPHLRSLEQGAAHTYRVYIPTGDKIDVRVSVTPLSGDADLFASTTVHHPNGTNYMWSGTTSGQDTISINHDDINLQRCVHYSPHCVLYVTVYGRRAGTYTVVASLDAVDSGFRVDEPASLARNYVFSTATFGPPLPVIGTSHELAIASPWEGCSEFTGVHAASLSGKIAVIGRGTCLFIEKTLHAQTAGAVGVVIVNTGDGVVGMAGTASQAVTIPTVMVSHADGENFKSILSSSIAVNVTLFAGVNRPPQLRNGVPQLDLLAASELKHYSFSVSGATRVNIALTSSMSPFNADLYVSTDGTLPSSTHYTFVSNTATSDALILRLGDPGFLTDGTYIIGVVNAGSGSNAFEIVASTDATPIVIREGNPIYGQADWETPSFYRFTQTEVNSSVRLFLTSLRGDPDICVTRNRTRLLQLPSVLGRWWELGSPEQADAYLGGMAKACDWSSTLQYSDVLTIPHTDRLGGIGEYFAAVVGSRGGANAFYLTVQTVLDTEVILAGGRPQRGELQAGTWNYYRLDVGADAANVTIVLTPNEGDPDIFVSLGGSLPTRANSIAQTSGQGVDMLVLGRDDDFLPPARLDIGVFGWTTTTYSIVATVALGKCSGAFESCQGNFSQTATQLQEGLLLLQEMREPGYAYFDLDVGTSATADDLQLTLTQMVGHPAMFAAFAAFPTQEHHDFAEGATPGVIELRGSNDLLQDCRRRARNSNCLLHAAVYCSAPCKYSILGGFTDLHTDPVVLIADIPQQASVPANTFAYFSFSVRETSSVSFVVIPSFGSPEMYVAVRNGSSAVLPSRNRDSYQWSAPNAAAGLRLSNFCERCDSLVVGITSATSTTFTITASRNNPGEHWPPMPPVVATSPPQEPPPDGQGGGGSGVGIFFLVIFLLLAVCCGIWLVRQWRAGQEPITRFLYPVRVRVANFVSPTSGTQRGTLNTELLTGDCLFSPMLTAPLASIPPLNPAQLSACQSSSIPQSTVDTSASTSNATVVPLSAPAKPVAPDGL